MQELQQFGTSLLALLETGGWLALAGFLGVVFMTNALPTVLAFVAGFMSIRHVSQILVHLINRWTKDSALTLEDMVANEVISEEEHMEILRLRQAKAKAAKVGKPETI